MLERHYGIIDQLIIRFDQQLTRHRAAAKAAGRDSPADTVTDITLNSAERDHVEGLMRVNHAGEVAAQALYQGQALISRDPVVRQSMRCSADEEIDHLDWCKKRLDELGGHTSYLNPVWYLGSFSIGALAGLAGAMSGPAASLVPPERRGSALAMVSGGMTLAFVVGIPLGSIIGSVFDWRATFLFAAGLSGLALVAVKDSSCQGCFIGVTPQVINEIKMQDKIVICESCARMLYIEEDL